MEHEYNIQNNNSICIIGGGASGYCCAYHLINAGFQITIFDKGEPLHTLLPTGGGRCNLAHAEYNFKELAKNYPRGEKFLYSVFSRFSTSDTIDMFKKIGIETYIQDDGRIFPLSDSSKDVRSKLLQSTKYAEVHKEEVTDIVQFNKGFKVITNKAKYWFKTVVIAIGGHSGYSALNNLDISLVPQKPALVGLKIKNADKNLSGISIKNCICNNLSGDILFTHYGLSGPLIYKISSIKAFDNFPYELSINLCDKIKDLQDTLNSNPHKIIKNILAIYLPLNLGIHVLNKLHIDPDLFAHSIDGKTRDKIIAAITQYNVTIINTDKGEETVMAGGIDLNEIIPQTMQLKKYPNLYAIGEIINIDGFCGGFNLQNAWSTAYIATMDIIQNS